MFRVRRHFTNVVNSQGQLLTVHHRNRRRNALLRPRHGVLFWSLAYTLVVAATTAQAMVSVERQTRNKPLNEKYYEAILKLPPM